MRRNTSTLLGTRAAIGLAVAACGVLVGTAQADTIEPTFDYFADLADHADHGTGVNGWFGGSGIPTDPTAISIIQDGGATITMALSATQRYNNPAVTNDGAGTYFAQRGEDIGGSSTAKWNFNWFIDVDGGELDDYNFELRLDDDPGADTQKDDHIAVDMNAYSNLNPDGYDTESTSQNSQNMIWWSPNFDPNAAGEYSFGLFAYDLGGNQLGEVGMHVQVIPLPAPVFMGLAGLAGVAVLRRRAVSQSA